MPPEIDMEKWAKAYPEYFGPNAVDPDEGKGDEEVQDFLSQFTARFAGYGSTFSTWGERHAFIVGWEIGFTLDKIEPVPTPKFWVKEAHYFKAGIACGYGAKMAVENSCAVIKNFDWKTIGASFGAGGIVATIMPYIMKLVGQ